MKKKGVVDAPALPTPLACRLLPCLRAHGARQSKAERLRSTLAAADARADEAEGALAGAQAEVETATRDLQARSALRAS